MADIQLYQIETEETLQDEDVPIVSKKNVESSK